MVPLHLLSVQGLTWKKATETEVHQGPSVEYAAAASSLGYTQTSLPSVQY